MALTDQLALVISANPDQAIRSFEKVGSAADKHLTRTEDHVAKAQYRMAAFGAKALAVAGVAGIALYDLATSASDLAESQNKVNVVFGDGSKAIRDFAKTAAQAAGLSERAALDAAANFGTLFTNIGKGSDEAASMSLQMTRLASDMASFSNTSPEEAVIALGAALRGEQEPIRRYGVLLSDQVLKQRALDEGLIETATGTLPPAIRAQAAYYEILAQTSKQQGDFARTANGAANQQRIFAAQLENFKSGVGSGVLPLFTQLLSGLNAVGSGFNNLPDGVKQAAGGMAGLATTGAAVAGSLALVASQIPKIRDTLLTAEQGAGVFGTSLTGVGAAAIGITAVLSIAGLAAREHAEQQRKAAAAQAEVADAITRDQGRVGAATRDLIKARLDSVTSEAKLIDSGVRYADIQNAIAAAHNVGQRSYELHNKALHDGAEGAQQLANSNEFLNGTYETAGNELDFLLTRLAQAGELTPELAGEIVNLENETKKQEDHFRALAERTGIAAAAVPDFVAAMQGGADSASAKADALEKLNDELNEYYDNIVATFDAELAYSASQRQTADAISSLAEAEQKIADAKKTRDPADDVVAAQEYAAALDDAAAAALAQAQAQQEMAAKVAEANGSTLNASYGASIYRAELQRQADSLAPDSPLRARILAYIAELDRAAAPRGGLLTLDAQQAIQELERYYNASNVYLNTGAGADARRIFGGRAGGGPVTGGHAYVVGERGPELFVPAQNGSVVPNGAGGGGTSITVNVSALDPQSGAQAVVDALERWQRANGPLPRRYG